MADGTIDSLSIDIGVSSSNAVKDIVKIADALKRLKDAQASVRKESSKSGGNVMKSMSSDAVNAMNKIDLLRMKLAALREQMALKMSLGQLDAKGIANAALQIKNLQAQIDKAVVGGAKRAAEEVKTSEKESRRGVSDSESVQNQVQFTYSLRENIRLIANEWLHVNDAVEKVKGAIEGINPKVKLAIGIVRAVGNALKSLVSTVWNIAKGIAKWTFNAALNAVKRVWGVMKKIASAAVDIAKKIPAAFGKLTGISNIAKSVGSLLRPLKSLARIALYRAARSAIKFVTDALQQGAERAYFFAKEYGEATRYIADSFDRLSSGNFKMQNQLGAAWATLLSAIEPVLIRIIQLVTKAAEAVTQFFALLGGKNTYLKAKDYTKAWADETGKGAKAAKEWKNQLLSFDEINRLDAPSDSGGGVGGNDFTDYENMFEEAAISSKFFDELKDAFEKGEWARLGTLIGDKFNEIVTKFDWPGWGRKIGRAVQAAVDVAYNFLKSNGFRNLGRGIAELLDNMGYEINLGTLGRLAVRIRTALWDVLYGAVEYFGTTGAAGRLAERLSDFVLGALYELTEWIASLNPQAIGNAIKEFFSNIKYVEIKDAFVNLIKTAWTFAIELKDELFPDGLIPTVTSSIIKFFQKIPWKDVGTGIKDCFKTVRETLTTIADEIFPEEKREELALKLKDKMRVIVTRALDLLWEAISGLHNVVNYKLGEILFPDWFNDWYWSRGDYAGKSIVMGMIHGEEDKAPDLKTSTNTFIGGPISDVLDGIERNAEDSAGTVSSEVKGMADSVAGDMNTMAIDVSGASAGIQTSAGDIATSVSDVGSSFDYMSWSGATAMSDLNSSVYANGQNVVNNLGSIRDAAIEAWSWLNKISDQGEARIEANGGIWTSLGGFASGGFPEDGLFMANHGELVGKFSNGRTAVANNEQITAGIADAVYDAFMTAFSQTNGSGGSGQPVNIYLDGRQIAQSTTKYQTQFARASGT